MRERIRIHLKKVYLHLFYFQRIWLERIRLKKRVRNKIKRFPQFKGVKKDIVYLQQAKQFLKKQVKGYSDVHSHFYFSTLNGLKKVEYISSELFFTGIEPALNNYKLATAATDKTNYENMFGKKYLPETIYKIVNGNFFDENNSLVNSEIAFQNIQNFSGELVVKPALESGGGKNVRIDSGSEITTWLKKEELYKHESFVLQKKIIQHDELAKFHPNSVNTCRILTARVQSEIVFLAALFRMGQKHMKVDNGSSGGIMCYINEKGQISEFGIDQQNNRYYQHPETGEKFKGFKIPHYQKALDFCLENHRRFLRFTFISWDIAIKKNGEPVFIEFNIKRQAIKEYQILNGPIFGKHTIYFLKQFEQIRKSIEHK